MANLEERVAQFICVDQTVLQSWLGTRRISFAGVLGWYCFAANRLKHMSVGVYVFAVR